MGVMAGRALGVVRWTDHGAESGSAKAGGFGEGFALVKKLMTDSHAAVFPKQDRFTEIVNISRFHANA